VTPGEGGKAQRIEVHVRRHVLRTVGHQHDPLPHDAYVVRVLHLLPLFEPNSMEISYSDLFYLFYASRQRHAPPYPCRVAPGKRRQKASAVDDTDVGVSVSLHGTDQDELWH
jgi:hypothetical protein